MREDMQQRELRQLTRQLTNEIGDDDSWRDARIGRQTAAVRDVHRLICEHRTHCIDAESQDGPAQHRRRELLPRHGGQVTVR